MKIQFQLIFTIIFLSVFVKAGECTLIDEGCTYNAKCYTGRLKISCQDGRTGFVDDKLVPDKLFGVENTSKISIKDLIKKSDKVAYWANNNKIDLSQLKTANLSVPAATKIYKDDFSEGTINLSKDEVSKYKCVWSASPKQIQGACPNSKPICSGNVICTETSTGMSISGVSVCLQSTAGTDCSSASACASSDDRTEVLMNSCALPGTDTEGNIIKSPIEGLKAQPKSKSQHPAESVR